LNFYNAGRARAEKMDVFQVIKQSPELVVLRTYGDYFIAAPFNRTTREVEKKVYLLKLAEMGKTPLQLEKVGPLKVKESSNTVPEKVSDVGQLAKERNPHE
jgi:hypothetical protein